MSEFEAQFDDGTRYSKLMPNDDFERLAFLNQRIDDIEGVLEIRDAENVDLAIARDEIQAIIRRLDALRDRLLNKRRPIDVAMALNVNVNRKDFKNKEAYERERARLLQELAAREQFLAQRDRLLDATKDFPWQVGVDGKKALPHQIDGANRLVAAERAILGDKPGLGKTLQAIMTIDLLRAKGQARKVLIFTPKSVLADFERSFGRWTNPTFVHVLNNTLKGMKGEQLGMLKHFPECIVITNYEVWRKDPSIHQALIECGFDAVFLDEAHALKNDKSVTTQKIRELVYAENLCPKCHGMNIVKRNRQSLCGSCEYVQEEFGEFCSVKKVYPLTGTPILNKPEELWPLLNLLDREGFPSKKNFLDDYCVREYDYKRESYYYTFGDGGSERLLSKLGMKYTARTRESAGVVMPPQEIKHHWLELDPEKYPRQHKFVTDLRDRARLAFTETDQMTTDAILAWYTRMRQAASWPDAIQIPGCWHDTPCADEFGMPGACVDPRIIFPPPGTPPIGESVIMDESQDIIFEAVEDGDRIVVFSMFRGVLAELERRCKEAGIPTAKIIGGVSDKNRQKYIDDFNLQYTSIKDAKYKVLLCQYQTAQVGLNLTGAQQLLCVEREWNPGKEEQTIDRLRRIDSEFNSIIHILHCAGTATELIDAIQDQKKQMLEGFQADVDLQEAMRKFLEG